MSIVEKLVEVNYIKEDLRSAINEHYGTEELVYSDGLVEYASAIDNIDTSNYTLPTEPKAVNFIDYDGTLLYAYTASEFQAMEGLPRNPWHSGLIAQGWNWTREEILDYLTRAERIDVGQNYITNDGATRYYIHKEKQENLLHYLHFWQGKASGVLVDWGDGNSERFTGTGAKNVTHTYNELGDYIISLLPDDDCEFRIAETTVTTTSHLTTRNGVFGRFIDSGRQERFVECYKVELGKGVTYIPSCAFNFFRRLECISIPKEVNNIGDNAFSNCMFLRSIVFPRNPGHPIVVIQYAFASCNYLKYICTTPIWSSNFCGSHGFEFCGREGADTYLLIPDTCTAMGGTYTVANSNFRKIYLSQNITALPAQSFAYCRTLQKINIEQVANFNDSFRECWNLRYIKIGENCTLISAGAFGNGPFSAYEIDLPSTITSIRDGAFSGSWNIRRLLVRATVPPTLANVNVFSGLWGTGAGASNRSTGTGQGVIYVPYSEDHSVLQAYLDTDATSSWAYYLTWCTFKELDENGNIPEES